MHIDAWAEISFLLVDSAADTVTLRYLREDGGARRRSGLSGFS
jgi:hypothetical protein